MVPKTPCTAISEADVRLSADSMVKTRDLQTRATVTAFGKASGKQLA